MRNFQDTFETRKRLFINAFSSIVELVYECWLMQYLDSVT